MEPRVDKIPAISTAMYPAPTTTLRLLEGKHALKLGHESDFQSHMETPNAYFGSSSKSKKPSLVMPKLAPVITR